MTEHKYRFAIRSDSEVVSFQSDFQKEVYHRYLEMNGLSEGNAMDAHTDWEDLQEGLTGDDLESEQPDPLPEKYTGDIYDELFEIYVDLSAIGLWAFDLDPCFESMEGMIPYYYTNDGEAHDISYQRVCDVFTKLGYEFQQKKDGAETLYFID